MASISSALITAGQREKLASVCVKPLKAELDAQASATELQELAIAAIRRAHGKLETAAAILALSDSHFGRLVNEGDLKLKQLGALGPETLAALGRELVSRYDALSSPEARAHSTLDTLLDGINELRQYVAHNERRTA